MPRRNKPERPRKLQSKPNWIQSVNYRRQKLEELPLKELELRKPSTLLLPTLWLVTLNLKKQKLLRMPVCKPFRTKLIEMKKPQSHKLRKTSSKLALPDIKQVELLPKRPDLLLRQSQTNRRDCRPRKKPDSRLSLMRRLESSLNNRLLLLSNSDLKERPLMPEPMP